MSKIVTDGTDSTEFDLYIASLTYTGYGNLQTERYGGREGGEGGALARASKRSEDMTKGQSNNNKKRLSFSSMVPPRTVKAPRLTSA